MTVLAAALLGWLVVALVISGLLARTLRLRGTESTEAARTAFPLRVVPPADGPAAGEPATDAQAAAPALPVA